MLKERLNFHLLNMVDVFEIFQRSFDRKTKISEKN